MRIAKGIGADKFFQEGPGEGISADVQDIRVEDHGTVRFMSEEVSCRDKLQLLIGAACVLQLYGPGMQLPFVFFQFGIFLFQRNELKVAGLRLPEAAEEKADFLHGHHCHLAFDADPGIPIHIILQDTAAEAN